MTHWDGTSRDTEEHWDRFKPQIKPELDSASLKDWLREELEDLYAYGRRLRARIAGRRA